MAKQILFGEEARGAIHKGLKQAARAVKVTLGPRGRNVVMDKGWGGPRITNDGVSIAREITLEDKFENMGAEIVKEVASKTNDGPGDGTTTTVVILEALVDAGIDTLTKGRNVMQVRTGMEKARDAAVEALHAVSRPVSGKDEVRHVATISAESEDLGAIIAETVEKVGKNGVVTVEESQGTELSYEVVEGMQLDKGYISPYLVTNPERMEVESHNPMIVVTDNRIANFTDMLPLIEKVAQSGVKELIVIADSFDADAITGMVVNKLRGAFSAIGITAPGYGDRKKEVLADIATIIGATVISADTGDTFENASLSMLGNASRIVVTKDMTTIVGGKGERESIDARIAQLKVLAENSSGYEAERINERVAKLSGGVAVIRVGAATETEMKYLKDKIDDAVKATKSAMDGGIVPGGGAALAHVAKDLVTPHGLSADEATGFEIVVTALSKPLIQIAENAGEDTQSILEQVQALPVTGGYDARADVMVDDMFAAGIIDPVKVTAGAVENAVSAAAILLTTEAAVADIANDKQETA